MSNSSGFLFEVLIRNLTNRWSTPEIKKIMASITMMRSILGLTLLFKLNPLDSRFGGGGGGGVGKNGGCDGERRILSLISRKTHSMIFLGKKRKVQACCYFKLNSSDIKKPIC